MAKRELLVTLGLDATTYAQEIRRANQLNKELDNAFKLLSSSSEGFEKTLEGLGKKQDYLGKKMKVATELSEVYTKRIKESKDALEETIKQSEGYKKTLDELNDKKDKGATLSQAEKKLLKETQQLYDKAQKSIVTYNTRISEGIQGYDKTQTALQELNREFVKSVEVQKNMGKDFFLNDMREEISKADQEFKLLSNSTENFNKTFMGLTETQNHYEKQIKNVNKLMDGLQQQIAGSNSELDVYRERIEETHKELRVWEELLEEINQKDPEYEYTIGKVEQLRKEYSELNAIVEVHEDRVKELTNEYKQNENAIVSMGAKIKSAKERVEELSKVFEFDKANSSINKFTEGTIEKLERELEQLEDDFTNVTNEVKDYENSLQGLDYKQKYLNQSLEKTNSILSEYEKEIDTSKRAIKEYEDTLQSLERQIERNADVGKEMANSGFGRRADEQATIVKELKEQYEKLSKEYENHQSKLKSNESAYKSLKQQLSSTKGEIVETANSADKLTRSLSAEKLERELNRVTSKFDELDSKLRLSVSKLEGLDMAFKRVSLESQHLSDKIELCNDALKEYDKSITHTSSTIKQLEDDYESLNRQLTEQKKKLEGLEFGDAGYTEVKTEIIKLETAINELDQEIDQHEQKLSGLKNAHTNLQAEINETIREQQQLKSTMTGQFLQDFGNQMQELGGVFQSAGMALMPLTLAIAGVGTASIKTGTEFYQSMSKVQAISGATGAELERLTAKAREMGAVTIWSSTDSAEALNYMALAGWNTQEMMAGIPAVLNLASAGNTDLALTSDIVTDGLTAMSMSANDATRYADIMAQTMSSSNTTIELMGETMKYAGSVAGGLGITMEDLSLAIGTMANAGIKGSMAGTALRGGLTRLITPTEKAQALMSKYGIEVKKTSDGNIDLRATMENLRSTVGGLDKDTQNMIAKTIFGQTAMNGWLTIINADADAFSDLALAIDTSAGSAERMAETMTDNLWGDLQELSSAVEESLISIFDAIEPMLREFVQTITNVVLNLTKLFNSLHPSIQKTIVIFTSLTALGAPLLIVFGAIMNAFGGIASGIGALSTGFGKLKTMFVGLDGTVNPFIAKLGMLGKKFLMLTGVAGAVAVAFGLFYQSMQDDAIESVDVITESMSDAGKALAEPFIDAKTEIDSVMLQMSNSNVAVTKDMVSQMETSLGTMVDNTVAVMEKSQSKVKDVLGKNMKELMDASEKEISSMKTKVDEIYKEKIKTVEEKEKAILQIQKNAQEKGRGLLVSEKSQIQQLLGEIQEISLNSMSVMNSELASLERKMIENRDSLNAESISKAVKDATEKRDKIISEATKEYDELIAIQKMLGDSLSAEEKSKLDEMVGLAKLRKDNLIQVANDEYASLIQSARRLARDSVDEIDWATGEVKTKWEVFTSGFGDGLMKIFGDLSYEFMQFTNWTRKFGLDIDILLLKWQKLWAKGDEKDAIQEKINGLEKQKKQIVELNDAIIKSIDRVQDLPADISRIAYDIDGVLRSNLSISLADFVNDVDGYLTQASEDFNSLPIEVQGALIKYNQELLSKGVNGGLKQLVQYVKGDIKNIRMEFEDLPKSAQSAISLMEMYFTQSADELNGVTFEEFVLNAQIAGVDVAKAFENLPPDIRKAMEQIPKEDWKSIMEYYKMATVEELIDIPEEFKKTGEESGKSYNEGLKSTKEESSNAGKELGKSANDGAKSTKEESKQAGKETGDAYNQGTKSAKEESKQAGKELGSATNEGFKGGLQDLPNALKEQLANAGVTIQNDGQIIVQDFDKLARDGVTSFVNSMNAQLPQLDGVTLQISDRLAGIDNIRLGNVTKQLSEVNRWLGVVQGTAVGTYASMNTLTLLKWGNTTRGLSQVNQWLMRTSNRAKDSRNALVQLTNLPFGNTTKGLSEVNQWLMRTTNRSKDSRKALKSITEVTYGSTTKGLSEINKWLKDNITPNAVTAHSKLLTLSKFTFSGVISGLKSVNSWLQTVKNTAGTAKSALYAVSQVKIRTTASSNNTQTDGTAQVSNPLARDSWLDFGNITKYKTSGDFYSPKSASSLQQKSQSNSNSNKEVLQALVKQNELLMQLLSANRDINIGVQVDGRQIAKASARYMEDEMNTIKTRKDRLGGRL